MTKIEEILSGTFRLINMDGSECEDQDEGFIQLAIETGVDYESLISCIEKYAEFYAKRCLEIAAENARIQINCGTGIDRLTSLNYSEHNILHECFIDDRTITDIKLPDHE